MPLEVVLLVLVSSVIHAGWNARLHRMENPEVVIVMAYLCVGVVLLPAAVVDPCLLFTSPSPRDRTRSRMPSSA